MNQKGIAAHILIVLALVAGVVFILFIKIQPIAPQGNSIEDESIKVTKTPEFVPPEGWVMYKFKNYPLSLWYPKDFVLSEKQASPKPSGVLQTDPLIVTVSNNEASMAIYPDDVPRGYTGEEVKVNKLPIIIDNQQLMISGTKVEKWGINYATSKLVTYDITLHFPIKPENSTTNIITASYYNKKGGEVSKENQEVFDKIISSFEFD